jgi:hypothetical protein
VELLRYSHERVNIHDVGFNVTFLENRRWWRRWRRRTRTSRRRNRDEVRRPGRWVVASHAGNGLEFRNILLAHLYVRRALVQKWVQGFILR